MQANNALIPNTPITMQSQATTGAGQILRLRGQSQQVTVVLQSHGTTSGGAVTIEECYFADDANPYAGTWSVIGSAVNASSFTGGAQSVIHIIGYSIWALRVRISSDITGGGSVTVVAWGN